ncbi:MAG TPA: hypothetical protein VG755_43635 [Nannocystaceae bacterium]|nr:hypothetical protein [Nannocystaceae bacterium]
MGRDARIKRARRRAAQAQPSPPVDPIPETGLAIMTGPPFPGCEDEVADDGYFDDCPICQALRAGDPELALQRMREQPTYMDLRDMDEHN